jgi:ubiquitin carboxyl-terminal hydrolase 36/42
MAPYDVASTIYQSLLDGVNGYRCRGCTKQHPLQPLSPARTRLTLHEAPAVLVVHLKRFDYDGGKINKAVSFDDELSLRGHMSATAPEKHGPKYCLYAVVVHVGGSATNGHYYAYVCKPALRGWQGGVARWGPMQSARHVIQRNFFLRFLS